MEKSHMLILCLARVRIWGCWNAKLKSQIKIGKLFVYLGIQVRSKNFILTACTEMVLLKQNLQQSEALKRRPCISHWDTAKVVKKMRWPASNNGLWLLECIRDYRFCNFSSWVNSPAIPKQIIQFKCFSLSLEYF